MVGKKVVFALLIVFALAALLVNATDQTDFISIDCGASTAYSDATTSIRYVSDAAYIDTGVNADVLSEFKTSTEEEQFLNVRSFPDGTKNCYTLAPLKVGGAKYLIRARFMYGNYDLKFNIPKFDIYLGVDYWETVVIKDYPTVVTEEIIYVPSSNFTHVCLVNTGQGTPFISVLELRLFNLDRRAYAPASGSLKLLMRLNLGSDLKRTEDLYDRIWTPFYLTSWTNLSTSEAISTNNHLQASIVMATAIAPLNGNFITLSSRQSSQSDQFYIYCHFADLQIIQANQSREFEIYVDGNRWYGPFKPPYLGTFTVYNLGPETTNQLNVTIRSTANPTFPPIINAFEAYTVVDLTHVGTYPGDDVAMKNIKSIYGVKKNWQGDPCVPQNYLWEGLDCSNAGDDPKDPPRIIFLNLSSSGLTKEITSYISSLTSLQYLDLSHNNLTGSVPNFLSEMASLTVLNLTGNNLTGNLPPGLIDKRNKKILTLIVDPGLCSTDTCNNAPNPKNNNIIIIIVCSLVALLILIAIILAGILWMIKKRKQKGSMDRVVAGDTRAQEQQEKVAVAFETNKAVYAPLRTENQRFTYSEILCITNNFQRPIGKGGFGTVYHGNIGDSQVAVKMLSPSSVQGYKQFHAEAKLLMRVHHKNLTTLVGYCEEGGKLGLIYEYMENGDLQSHLSAKRSRYLTWEARLNIALDTAQGLEYLHNGCKPPIIHRDVKSTNILLNGRFQAKLADFGLSRVFPADDDAQTTVAGTPGYLDPEYYSTQRMSEKADVFGFGVVLLEIITGQPPINKNRDQTHISQWVSDILSSNADITLIIEPRLQKDFDINSAWKAVEVAMACVSSVPSERPDMNQVVIELKECLAKEKWRTNVIYGSDPIDSIEMEPLNINTGMSPLVR